ncbi:hypothetical protein KM043_000266 [Ampulex compressa]|nr:hypothetical protein KM043_000266 [Ampulex compressa]
MIRAEPPRSFCVRQTAQLPNSSDQPSARHRRGGGARRASVLRRLGINEAYRDSLARFALRRDARRSSEQHPELDRASFAPRASRRFLPIDAKPIEEAQGEERRDRRDEEDPRKGTKMCRRPDAEPTPPTALLSRKWCGERCAGARLSSDA